MKRLGGQTHKIQFPIYWSFVLSFHLYLSGLAYGADLTTPIPCETNPQNSNSCEIGLRSCDQVKTDLKNLLQENVEKIINFHQDGRDVNLASAAVPPEEAKYPETIDLFDRNQVTSLRNDRNCSQAQVNRNGAIDLSNNRGCKEIRLAASIADKSMLCQFNAMAAEIDSGSVRITHLACQQVAEDALKLYQQTQLSSNQVQKVFLASIGEETNPFCNQKDNTKSPTKVTDLCEKAAQMAQQGTYDKEVNQHLQSACALASARTSLESAIAHVYMCELLARWDEERQSVILGSNSELTRFLSQNLGSQMRRDARRAARRDLRRGRISRARRSAQRAAQNTYNAGIVQAMVDFGRNKYGSCSVISPIITNNNSSRSNSSGGTSP